ncbi:3-hydroxyacyl-CoA dehydrogenase [Azoarcus sp. KH32C]|uniref:3-hydroxyacyl-CoA dehydrogenase n=1 Tax=Azoarcus sp. KH32C TaxID=748247 RepID=UPI00023865EA|nr:3-hydroxyacyl-CoA dehydrogenase [Azoarcus sp. KH32C]BAL24169.1 3-hydroxybutyryl-CoA dehydrogenase [Azoarcus sp. KH32C]
MSPLPHSCPVAVIGSGAMGSGIAQVAAQAGHPVRLFDARPDAAASAVDAIRKQFFRLADKGRLPPAEADAAGARLSAAASLADLAGCGLVIEAIVENLDAKRSLFRDLEEVVDADCLFATNTSSISVTAIAAGLRHPGRVVGMHFFNPAPLMALVEIVSGLATDRTAADTVFATAAAWGKRPVRAKSTPGFIVNRVARPYYSEALRLLNEGVADCATLDALMREAGGFRMGPFELMDLIGLDVNFAVTNSVWQAFFNDARYTPSQIQQEYVAAGWFGRKSGRGFYDYGADAVKPEPNTVAPLPLPPAIALHGASLLAEALAQRLAARDVRLTRQPESHDGLIATAGKARLYVTDGRSATRRAADNGFADTVVVDLAADYATASRLALAAAETCSNEAADAAIGLLQAAGIAVSHLRDTPGLPVMRTVAMLANEASDAVNQGVSDPGGIDTAMRLGVGYPRGPLEWAESLGLPAIRTVLAHLADAYGEDRYRISPLIEQRYFAAMTPRNS